MCPEGPGTGQAVVASEQRVGSRECALLIVPRPCSALSTTASPVLVWPLSCVGGSRLWGLEPSFLGSGASAWLVAPNGLSSPLCGLLQQMTRSQQMDELLDVLIESGGMLCFPLPLQGSPAASTALWGSVHPSTALPCPPRASTH